MKRNTLHLEPDTNGEVVGKCRRAFHLHVMVSEEERTLIKERMAEAEIRNMEPTYEKWCSMAMYSMWIYPPSGSLFPCKGTVQTISIRVQALCRSPVFTTSGHFGAVEKPSANNAAYVKMKEKCGGQCYDDAGNRQANQIPHVDN